MNANNHPKLRERRFLNATLIYFKISIANVAIALCHGGVPTRMTRSIIVGPLFSLYLYYLPYLCMYVKVIASEFRAVGLTQEKIQLLRKIWSRNRLRNISEGVSRAIFNADSEYAIGFL